MPFGLTNAPATFQRIMERIFTELPIYIDDLLVPSPDEAGQLAMLRSVFQKAREHGVRFKIKKCIFFRLKVEYLGHFISQKGVETDDRKIRAVQNFPTPRTPKQVKSFLGLAGYYRRFVQGFGAIAGPLNRLLTKDVKFYWSPECQQAFETLKTKMTQTPVLAYPNWDQEFTLTTDASIQGLGAVIEQVSLEPPFRPRPIAYASRALVKTERRYSISDMEGLAVVWACKHFRHYLRHRPFKIVIDHEALQFIYTHPKRLANSRLAKWALALQDFEFTIQHKKGAENVVADALSRNPEKPRELIPTATGSASDALGFSTNNDDDDDDDDDNEDFFTNRTNQFKSKYIPGDEMEVTESMYPPETVGAIVTPLNLWILALRKDKVFGPIVNFFETGTRPTNSESLIIMRYISDYCLEDGFLYRWHLDLFGKRRREAHKLLVVPTEFRQQVCEQMHSSKASGGHMGEKPTFYKVATRYYWPSMGQDIKKFVNSCVVCARFAYGPRRPQAPLKLYSPVAKPLDRIFMDVVHFRPSACSNTCALVIVDQLTRWAEAYPMKNEKAELIAKIYLTQFILRYGVPREVVTDQGANFLSDLMEALYRLTGSKKLRTTAYHPQSNGVVERFNSTLRTLLKKNMALHQRDWDEWVPWALFTYRTSLHSSLQDTPFFMFLGRDAYLHEDLYLPTPPTLIRTVEDYKHELLCNMLNHWERAKVNISGSLEKMKERCDIAAYIKDFQVGDIVMRDISKFPPPPDTMLKMRPRYDGPYRIIEVKSPQNVCLSPFYGPTGPSKPIHVDRLRLLPPGVQWENSGLAPIEEETSEELAVETDCQAQNILSPHTLGGTTSTPSS